MVSRPLRAGATALLAFVLFSSCSAQGQSTKKLVAEDLSIAKADGSTAVVHAEIASNDEDRTRGLMFRKVLSDGDGMLFVFESDRELSFWMKNTYVPLSIAFIASDGRIIEIRDMDPLSLAPINSERSVRFALEVPRGWFSRVFVTVGDRISLPKR
ncbi:MAG: DUF192 domain-containing protein [Treponemataceae bacterium]